MKRNKLLSYIFLVCVFIGAYFIAPVNAEKPERVIVKEVFLPSNAKQIPSLSIVETVTEVIVRDTIKVPVYRTRTRDRIVEKEKNPRISEKALEIIAPIKMADIPKQGCPQLN